MAQSDYPFGEERKTFLQRFRSWSNRYVTTDPERLVSSGRLTCSLFAALAIYLDPTQPTRSVDEVYRVLWCYVAFSLLLAIFPSRRPPGHSFHLLTHGVDVLMLATVVYLTGELDSPFFPLVPFLLLATTMRWGMRGAVLGALAMEIMMIAVGWQDLADGDSELNLVIMRSGYFLVAAVMLGYFGAYRSRSGQRFAQLASWAAAPVTIDNEVWQRDVMDQASRLLGARRLILVWKDSEQAGAHIVMSGPEGLRRADVPALAGINGRNDSSAIDMVAGITGWTIPDYRDCCSAPFSGMRNAGRLYVLDAQYRHEDASSLAEITALRIGHELDRLSLTLAIADSARNEERVRLARDLHDSVLQDLTAARLKLKAAAVGVPDSVGQSLQAVGDMMVTQQKRIRMFVEGSRNLTTIRPLSSSLSQNVNDLCDQWGCEIGLTVTPSDMEAPPAIHRELSQLLSEATANAVRHGGATRLNVKLSRVGHGLSLSIADNGCGMMIEDGEETPWPRSLHARVEDMDGSLAITRYAPGLAMLIEVPLP
jgi:Signal transduction histidine kinase